MRNNRAHELRGQSFSLIQLSAWQKVALAFLILAVMALPWVQPVRKKSEEKKEIIQSSSEMVVSAVWPGCSEYDNAATPPKCTHQVDIDIDLWCKSPDDERPVGYSNKEGKTFNLIRDDLGASYDRTDRNEEQCETRGLPPGEYIINLHYFKDKENGRFPEVPVDVTVSTRGVGVNGGGVASNPPIKRKVILRVQGEELTVMRFVVDGEGKIDTTSINDFHQELRTWQPPTP